MRARSFPDDLTIGLDDGITIRPAESIADYRACQEAQRRAWGIADDSYLIPIATLVGAQHHGGLVLGAFRPEGDALAMSFAFLGRIDGNICLYSQLTGVVPGFQSLGLGYRIKLVQRQFAAAEGIATIAWAFDPLQAGNARFNLEKLGASASRYVENMYGERTDRLNFGVPTDRLIAEWPAVPSESFQPPVSSARDLPTLIATEARSDGERSPIVEEWQRQEPWAFLPVPPDIARLRGDNPELAEAWRVAVKEAFSAAFGAGYRAVGFRRSEDSTHAPEAGYLLHRPPR